ncbi:hypothetical protein DL93DRAFT_2092338 [Clavulina sp. PMI_390]|nr:hypothetical protein DL93DRAFT_2092338 [Clavulina sp. PMI_390]
MNPSTEDAIALWPTYFSPSLTVIQNGKSMSSDDFLQQMKDAKAQWPIIDVRYRILNECPETREVASAEYVWIPNEQMWFDTVILMKFGDVGTEDENRVVQFVEIMKPGPKDRDPASTEAQSII